jgi:glycosyltransferase involved in cell wall biosynthesis
MTPHASHVILTIFTSTYNRAHLLPRLFESVAAQVEPGDPVEWLVIDDGSTDDTAEVLAGLVANRPDMVRYLRVENGGKHRAINRGLDIARGAYFFIVDSDDYLLDGSILKIIASCKEVESDKKIIGVAGLMVTPNGNVVGGKKFRRSPVVSNNIDRRQKYGVCGDIAIILKTREFRSFKFPEIAGEFFIAESIVWNRMAHSYGVSYRNEIWYVADYQDGGLSRRSVLNRRLNPIGTTMLYSELFINRKSNVVTKMKALINYWRFFPCRREGFSIGLTETRSIILSLLLSPIALLLHLYDAWRSE